MYTHIYIYIYIHMLSYVSNTSDSCLSQCRSQDRDRISYLTAESDSDLSDFFLSRLPADSRVGSLSRKDQSEVNGTYTYCLC